MKECKKCKRRYEATLVFFYKVGGNKDGLATTCKGCAKSQARESYRKNREATLERAAKYYEKNAEDVKEYERKKYHDNKDRENERSRRYYRKNKSSFSLRQKRYYLENPGLFREYSNKRRTLKRKLPATLTEVEWEKAIKTFDGKCAYCAKDKPLAQDHFVPLSKGGPYSADNIIPSCKSCNSSKRDNDFADWYPKHESYNSQREKRINEYVGVFKKTQ